MNPEEMNQSFHKISKRKLVINLVINWFIPMLLVVLIRSIYANDVLALAIAGIIPVGRTIFFWLWRRRFDWIGISSVIGFAVALTVSGFSGGSSLPLKLYHPIVTGTIGLILLISTIIRMPLLIIILRALKHGDLEQYNNPKNYRKFMILTVALGFIFLVDAVIHIVMALTLSTVAFFAMSKVVTLSILAIFVIVRWIVRRNK